MKEGCKAGLASEVCRHPFQKDWGQPSVLPWGQVGKWRENQVKSSSPSLYFLEDVSGPHTEVYGFRKHPRQLDFDT